MKLLFPCVEPKQRNCFERGRFLNRLRIVAQKRRATKAQITNPTFINKPDYFLFQISTLFCLLSTEYSQACVQQPLLGLQSCGRCSQFTCSEVAHFTKFKLGLKNAGLCRHLVVILGGRPNKWDKVQRLKKED